MASPQLYQDAFPITYLRFDQELEPIEPSITSLPDYVWQLISPITGAKIYLIGTAHVSEESIKSVREIIRFVKPNVVMIELCINRVGLLADDKSSASAGQLDPNQKQTQQPRKPRRLLESTSGVSILVRVISNFYESAIKQLKSGSAGGEFRAAYEEAKRLKALLVLGDRQIQTTLQRLWAAVSLREKFSLGFQLMTGFNFEITPDDVERMKNSDILTEMVKEVSREYPSLLKPILYERDEFMTAVLRACPGPVVVGVVGQGHVQGIRENWEKRIEMEELNRVPQPEGGVKRAVKLAGVVLVLLLVLVVVLVALYFIFSLLPYYVSLGGFALLICFGIYMFYFNTVRVSEMLDSFDHAKNTKSS